MKKQISLISAILFLICAHVIALPLFSGTGVHLSEPCPCDGNYTRVEAYYVGEDNVRVDVFSNSDLSPANLIVSFPVVNSGQVLLIDGTGLSGAALPVRTYLRITNSAAAVNTIQIYTRCPSEVYPGATEALKILGKTFGPFTVFAVTDQANSFRCTISNAEQGWRIGGNLVGSVNNTFGTLNNESVLFMTNHQNRGIITDSGNFGLGTTTPASRLDVLGKGFFRQNGDALGLVGQDHSYLQLYPDGTMPRAAMGYTEAGSRKLAIENTFAQGDLSLKTPRNIVLNSSRIAIGGDEADLDTKMHIVGNGVRLSTSLTNLDRAVDLRTDGAGVNLNAKGADLFIRSQNGHNIYLNAQPFDGRVGIGTTNIPTNYMLAVDGRVICEELRVRNSADWPDYVFEKDYTLLPLDELEAYVKEFKHLPGIPTALSIEKEQGFDIGEMQRKLVEKIEELTLYTIDLNVENKTLKEQLEQTNAQMTEIVKRLRQLEQK